MSSKIITQLTPYSASSVKNYDLLFITDIDNQETKKITAGDLVNYTDSISGSSYRTGSFIGNFSGSVVGGLTGTASWANNSITSSYSLNSLSSSYALTASYALNGGNGGGIGDALEETILQNDHGFTEGDVLYKWAFSVGDSGLYYLASSVFNPSLNYANEVVGIVKNVIDVDTFVICYNGIVEFNSVPVFFGNDPVGTTFYVSGSGGGLSGTDPGTISNEHVSKPYLVKTDNNKGYILNSRALYTETGSLLNSLSSSYALTASYAGNASNAITASYALNGGGGGGGGGTTIITQSYINTNVYQSLPVGGVMAFATGSIPLGWLECNGDIILKTGVYAALYTAIRNENPNTSFGYTCNSSGLRSPSGTHFKLPDLRGEFIRGWDNGKLTDSGRVFGSHQSQSVGPHIHTILNGPANASSYGGADNTPAQSTYGVSIVNGDPTWTWQTEINTGNETRPRNISMVFCIRYANLEGYSNVTTASYISGDVVGSLAATSVTKLRGIPLTSSAPQTYDVLSYNGSSWTNTPITNLPLIAQNVPVTFGIAYPLASISTGSTQYVWQYNRHQNVSKILKLNTSTNNVTLVNSFGHAGRNQQVSLVKSPTNNEPYYVWGDDGGRLYNYRLSTGTLSSPFLGGVDFGNYNFVKLNDASPSHEFFAFASDYNFAVYNNAINLFRIYKPTTTYTVAATGSALNLVGTSFENSGIYTGVEGNVAAFVIFITYNPIKQRLYLITTGTGLLHVFKLTDGAGGSWVGDILSWWLQTPAVRFTKLKYEKSLSVGQYDSLNSGISSDRYALDYDIYTGEENHLTIVRFGETVGLGSITKIPWVE